MDVINYFPLLIIFTIAWLVPMLLSWLEISKIPTVIAEIIMGVLIGPFGLDLVTETPYSDFLYHTGFLFLIFLAGLEIDISKITTAIPKGKIHLSALVSNTLLLALFIYLGSLILSFIFVWGISFFIELDTIFYAMLLPTVALSITVPILKSDGELNHKFGQIILMEGAIATIISIILVSIYSGVLKNGFRVELLLFTIIFVVFTVTYYIGKKLIKIRTFQSLMYALEHAASQIRVRGTVALLMLFVVIAHLINTELVLGAFFAGILLSLFIVKERSALLFKLDGMSYGFFIPIFFIMVGVNLDVSSLRQFGDSIPLIATVLLGFIITQVVPALIMIKLFGFKKALAGGMLLSARLGLTIATSQIGLSLQVITPADNAGIITAAIITTLISPLIFRLLNRKESSYYNIYILGGSKSSLYLSERIKIHDLNCLTLIQNKEIIADFEHKRINFKILENFNPDILDNLDLRPSDLVIILTESDHLNHELALYVKNNLNHGNLITNKYSADEKVLEQTSHTFLIDTDIVIARHVEELIVRPDSTSSLSESFGLFRIEEIKITCNDLHYKQVKEIAFPLSGSLIMKRRGSEISIPRGDTQLLVGDIITVIGNNYALSKFREIFEAKKATRNKKTSKTPVSY